MLTKEIRKVIAETYRYCPLCDGKHKMPLTKRTVLDTTSKQQHIKYVEIFNYCAKNDYELEVCKQLKKQCVEYPIEKHFKLY